jgi:hypothetical protein
MSGFFHFYGILTGSVQNLSQIPPPGLAIQIERQQVTEDKHVYHLIDLEAFGTVTIVFRIEGHLVFDELKRGRSLHYQDSIRVLPLNNLPSFRDAIRNPTIRKLISYWHCSIEVSDVASALSLVEKSRNEFLYGNI